MRIASLPPSARLGQRCIFLQPDPKTTARRPIASPTMRNHSSRLAAPNCECETAVLTRLEVQTRHRTSGKALLRRRPLDPNAIERAFQGRTKERSWRLRYSAARRPNGAATRTGSATRAGHTRQIARQDAGLQLKPSAATAH